VEVGGSGEVEGSLEEDLAGGGFEEVSSANDFGGVCGCVVDYGGELIARDSVSRP
jgi:hypothetical protein